MSEEKLSWDEEAKRKFDKALDRVVSGEQTEENEASSKYKVALAPILNIVISIIEICRFLR